MCRILYCKKRIGVQHVMNGDVVGYQNIFSARSHNFIRTGFNFVQKGSRVIRIKPIQ